MKTLIIFIQNLLSVSLPLCFAFSSARPSPRSTLTDDSFVYYLSSFPLLYSSSSDLFQDPNFVSLLTKYLLHSFSSFRYTYLRLKWSSRKSSCEKKCLAAVSFILIRKRRLRQIGYTYQQFKICNKTKYKNTYLLVTLKKTKSWKSLITKLARIGSAFNNTNCKWHLNVI